MPPKGTPGKTSATAAKKLAAAEEEKRIREEKEKAARENQNDDNQNDENRNDEEDEEEVRIREEEIFSDEENSDVTKIVLLDKHLEANANPGVSSEENKFKEEASMLKQRIILEKIKEKNLKLELELRKSNHVTSSQSRNLMVDSQTSILGFEQKTTVTNKVWNSGYLTDDSLRLKLSENSVETLDNIGIWLDEIFVLPREICSNGGSAFQIWKNKLVSLDKKIEHMVKIYEKIQELAQVLKEIKKFLEKCLGDLSFDTEKAGILQYIAVWGISSVGARVMGSDKGAEIERTMTISKRAFGQKFLHEKSALGLRNVKTGSEVRNFQGGKFNKYQKFTQGGRGGYGDQRGGSGRGGSGRGGRSRGRGRGGFNGGWNQDGNNNWQSKSQDYGENTTLQMRK